MENYSLSDISSVLGKDGAFGGSGMWFFALIVLLLLGNGSFFGNRNGEFNTFATAAGQNELLLGQKFDNVSRQINDIGNGICSLGYNLNTTILNEGRTMQSNIDSVRFDMSNYASAINANIDNKFAQMEKNQLNATIQAQANQINQLYLAQQMCGVVRYPNGMTYSAGTSPFCNCGCNCNL